MEWTMDDDDDDDGIESLEAREVMKTAIATLACIKPYLEGVGPKVQSVVIADMTATWALGWQTPEIRAFMLDRHVMLVSHLIAEGEHLLKRQERADDA